MDYVSSDDKLLKPYHSMKGYQVIPSLSYGVLNIRNTGTLSKFCVFCFVFVFVFVCLLVCLLFFFYCKITQCYSKIRVVLKDRFLKKMLKNRQTYKQTNKQTKPKKKRFCFVLFSQNYKLKHFFHSNLKKKNLVLR